jgi:hypothetical protein
MGDDQSHAVKGVAGRGVDAEDSGVGPVGQARVEVQLVGEFQPVVNVLRFAGHMLVGAVMLDAAAYAGCQVLREQGGEFGLGFFNGLVMVRHKLSPASRNVGVCSSIKYLRSRFCAVSRRYSLLARKSDSGVKSSVSARRRVRRWRCSKGRRSARLRRPRRVWGGGHAAECHAGGDHAVVEGQVEGGAHGADVVVQAFGNFVGAEGAGCGGAWAG